MLHPLRVTRLQVHGWTNGSCRSGLQRRQLCLLLEKLAAWIDDLGKRLTMISETVSAEHLSHFVEWVLFTSRCECTEQEFVVLGRVGPEQHQGWSLRHPSPRV